jgi:hypothetical protein
MVELQQAAPFAPIYMRRRANEDVPPQDRQKVE